MGIRVTHIMDGTPTEYSTGASFRVMTEPEVLEGCVQIFDDKGQELAIHFAGTWQAIAKYETPQGKEPQPEYPDVSGGGVPYSGYEDGSGAPKLKTKSRNGDKIRTHPDNGERTGRDDGGVWER